MKSFTLTETQVALLVAILSWGEQELQVHSASSTWEGYARRVTTMQLKALRLKLGAGGEKK